MSRNFTATFYTVDKIAPKWPKKRIKKTIDSTNSLKKYTKDVI